jgi:hypothetical protein
VSSLIALVKTANVNGVAISRIVDNQGKMTVNNDTLTLSGAINQVCNGVLTGDSWGSSTTASALDGLDWRVDWTGLGGLDW